MRFEGHVRDEFDSDDVAWMREALELAAQAAALSECLWVPFWFAMGFVLGVASMPQSRRMIPPITRKLPRFGMPVGNNTTIDCRDQPST